jgi:hypothetical protein
MEMEFSQKNSIDKMTNSVPGQFAQGGILSANPLYHLLRPFRNGGILLLIMLFLMTGAALSQETSRAHADSVLQRYISRRSAAAGAQKRLVEAHDKCGFVLSMEAKLLAAKASPALAKTLASLDSRPVLETSVVSQSGHFRIHYNVSSMAPTYSVSELCNALDSAYRFEVGFLGYPPPPPDGVNGGDDKLDVYLIAMGGDYGTTEPDSEISPGSNRFTSFIEMSYDYSSYPTKGIDAARVTAAHEFHHTIQIGNYAFRYDDSGLHDRFFFEMTSTSMEQFVYPTIKDYLFYTSSFFNAPWLRFPWHDGYDIAIWNLSNGSGKSFGIIRRCRQLS